MTKPASQSCYSSLSISLHWVMLILLVAVYACKELRGYYPKGSDFREGLKTWHFMLGLSVLLLVFVRIIARVTGGRPIITPAPPVWQTLFAKLTHLALYAFMISMPIAGWVILSASDKLIPFYGLSLPTRVGPDNALTTLLHHYATKNNTLQRILPHRRLQEHRNWN